MADVLSDDGIEVLGGCAAVHPDQRGGQHVAKMCPGVRVMSRSLGIGVADHGRRARLPMEERMTDDEIKAARALCEAATPGPWHCYHHEDYGWRIDAEKVGIVHGAWNEADGDLIAAARTLMPCLLDEIERLRGLVAAAAPGPWRDAVYGEAPKADAPLAPPVPRDASIPFEHTTLGRTATPYRCNVPMCGESGVCDACRKRGAR